MALRGIRETKAKLKQARRQLGQPLLRRIARRGGTIVRDEARQQLSGVRAKSKKSVIAQERKSPPGQAVVHVGIKRAKGSAWYLKFRELGTRPHIIDVQGTYLARRGEKKGQPTRPKKGGRGKKVLKTKGGIFLGPSVQHPGQRPQPFLKPAALASRPRVEQAAQAEVRQSIAAVVGKGGLPGEPALD